MLKVLTYGKQGFGEGWGNTKYINFHNILNTAVIRNNETTMLFVEHVI